MRLEILREGERLTLRKRGSAYAGEFAVLCMLAVLLWGAVLLVWMKGRDSFDQPLRVFFPVLFAVPLAFVPRLQRLFRAVRGETFQFDRRSETIFRDGSRLAFWSDVLCVKLSCESNQDGADLYRAELILRRGGRLFLDESYRAADVNEIVRTIAEFTGLPVEGYHGWREPGKERP